MMPRVSILLLVLLLARVAGAATLRVERDGTGDYTTIQDAIDAASPGDLIVLGPGRYTEFTSVVSGSTTFRRHAYVTVDDLTFRGVDGNTVIIGPESGPPQLAWAGFVLGEGVQTFTVETMTMVNLYDGMNLFGEHVRVRECHFVACDVGVVSFALYETLVEDCVFQGSLSLGIITGSALNSTGVLIQNCLFENGSGGIDLQTEGNIVQGCTFRNNVVGLQFSFGATGSLLDCVFENNDNAAVSLTGGASCTMMNNEMHAGSGETVLLARGGSFGEGQGNVFDGGSYVTILLSDLSTLNLSNCHILRFGSRPSVWTQSGQGTGHIIDLRNNYWGTNDAVEIADSITDHQDYPQLTGTVLFEPFLTGPVGTREQSFGGLKSSYSRPD